MNNEWPLITLPLQDYQELTNKAQKTLEVEIEIEQVRKKLRQESIAYLRTALLKVADQLTKTPWVSAIDIADRLKLNAEQWSQDFL